MWYNGVVSWSDKVKIENIDYGQEGEHTGF